ncbi:LCP family protein [Metabacillus herbersteinensis]|uniref:LCP family protein n=1 Tax=Metabacillus herbersteinensis TaxID=283816 RepID=A0ABV6GEX1_9BACI
MKKNSRREHRKKKKSGKKFIRKMLLLLFLVALAYIGYLAFTTFQAANNSYEELENRDGKSKLREQEVDISKDPFSVLLIGVENYSSGKNSYGRSDTLMVATFNPSDSTMKLLSIPRDTRVYVEERGKKDKINHAFAFGGKESTIETIEDFLDIPIDYYATINFKSFVNIIDILDGVTVDVPFDFSDYKGGDWETKYYFEKGEMNLTGDEALTYARMRKKDPLGDRGRNERQKQIVEGVIDKINTPSSLFKIDDITKEIGKNVETNLRVSYLLALQDKYSSFSSENIKSLTLEGEDEYIDGIYYLVPDEESVRELSEELRQHLNHGSSNENSLDETN